MILIKKNFFLLRTIRVNMEKRREERELDVEHRFAAAIADNLRQLPVRAKLLVKSEIRNTLSIKWRCLINAIMLVPS